MKALQQAAREALERAFDGRRDASLPIERLTVDVTGSTGHELVSLRMREDELLWSCTCGLASCEHVHAALQVLADAPRSSSVPPPLPRELVLPSPSDAPVLPADRRILPEPERRRGVDPRALAELVDDLLLSVARSGVAAGRSPSVGDAIARLRRGAPAPVPIAFDRWLGRLEQALAAADVDDAALVLAGASALVDDLRAPDPAAPERQARLQAWLGTPDRGSERPRLTDRSLLEIAREQLAGATRFAIERRHLIDLDSGELYREERVQGGDPTSLGPCPRLLSVWLATLEPGPPPTRVQVLQYTATPVIEPDVWERVLPHAQRDFAALAERYRREVAAFPGLSEPFALVTPARVEAAGQALIDAAGRALALATPDGAHSLRALGLEGEGSELLWLCGRLCDHRGGLAVQPAGAAVKRQGRVSYVQL